MANAIVHYLTLNQLLLGKPFKNLPSTVKDFLNKSGLKQDYDKAYTVPSEFDKASDLCKMFLNMMRTPDYAFNVSQNSGAVIRLSDVADTVRTNGLDVEQCSAWATMLISSVNYTDAVKDSVSDGVLCLGKGRNPDNPPDLDGELKKAFSLFCWGSTAPTDASKEFLMELIPVVDMKEDVHLPQDKLRELMCKFREVKLSPKDVGAAVLMVHDLSHVADAFKCLAFWGNAEQSTVEVIIPRNTSTEWLAKGVIDANHFLDVAAEDPDAMARMRAKGGRITFGDKK